MGFLGTITNLILFYLLVDAGNLPALPVSVFTFVAASIQNYLLNHFWTFSIQTVNQSAGVKNYFRYLSVAVIALGINLTILWWLLNHYHFPMKVIAQAIGILGGMVFNFFGSKFWVFKSRE